MVEKKKGKQIKDDEEHPTKEEYAVAKDLRFSLPAKEGRLHGMDVKYFIGSEAVDCLMKSKWSAAKSKDALFTSREKCVAYMQRLLKKNMFHRAEREKRRKDKTKDKPTRKKIKDKEEGRVKDEGSQPEEEVKDRKSRREKKSKKEKELDGEDEPEKKNSEKKEEKKKKEKRLKLIMPEKQFFEDSDEVYVWIFDPVHAKNFFIGLLMVLGAIALCMFPLWPEAVRVGVYYLSVAAAGFVGFILGLVVIRLILFCCIWLLTFGRHHFWLLPNLTEDVGFLESFRPLYKHDVVAKDTKAVEGKKKKGESKGGDKKKAATRKKDTSSDKEDSEYELIKQEDLAENSSKNNADNDEEEEVDDEYDEENAGEEDDGQDRVEEGEDNDDSSLDVEEDDGVNPNSDRSSKKTN